jgi:hypothetical protein
MIALAASWVFTKFNRNGNLEINIGSYHVIVRCEEWRSTVLGFGSKLKIRFHIYVIKKAKASSA